VACLHQMKLFLDFLCAHVHAFPSEEKLQLADEIELFWPVSRGRPNAPWPGFMPPGLLNTSAA
jgi:hypothetical protein